MAKKQTKSAIELVNLSADDPTLLTQNVKTYTSDGIVNYGNDNSQFDYLIRLATYSTTHGAIIDAISLLLFGEGLNVKGIIADNDLRRITTDFYMFGNGAIQVVNGTLMHVPVNYLRAEEVNEEGKIENYYYNTDWINEPDNYTILPNWELNPKAKHSIYYLRPYRPNAFYYNLPTYQSCLAYCELEENVGQYLLNTVENSFSVLKIINANNGTGDEDSRNKFVRDVKRAATGVKGDKLIVAFAEDKEHAITVEDISVDNAADQYQYLSTEAQNKILVGHKLTSPLILGIRDVSSGFSSNADELQMATDLFMKMQIEPKQRFIANGINILTGRDDLEFLNETIEEVTDETQLSKVNTDLEDFISLGADDLEGFELFDSEEVDYEIEDELDEILEKHFELTNYQKLINLISTGTARPNAKSSQDREDFIVRYRYKGEGKGDREFCSAMISADKLFRKEDILQLSKKSINPGFGVKGSDKYNIWLGSGNFKFYKGGARCHHYWQREIYLKAGTGVDVKNPLAKKISVARASKLGTVEKNDPKVAKHPNDMKHKAFVTKATMPSDAKAKTTGL